MPRMVPHELISVSAASDRLTLTGEAHIENVLVRSAETDAANIRVATDGGKATLSGNVRSWSESDEVARAAWTAPGVHEVQNDLIVIP